jgi:hypothetical protein
MRRDWLTLAFGIALVGAVVGLSLRQNMIRERSVAPPASGSTTAAGPNPAEGPPSAPPPAATPAAAPAAPAGRASSRGPVPASAPASDPADTSAVLQVQSDVPGASVFLDREFVGTTPLTLRGLTAGAKQLNVTATGHDGYSEAIALAKGPNRVSVEFLKVRLNATIPVVHRHAMGSCQGMLAASVKGLTYDTANKADAFTVTLADIQEFEVDYLKKNLRLRRREGKTWNFTNDNADALFVFHRDVAKARDRLTAAR